MESSERSTLKHGGSRAGSVNAARLGIPKIDESSAAVQLAEGGMFQLPAALDICVLVLATSMST
jgi:hypothetical protein